MSSKYVISRTKRQEVQAKSEEVTSLLEAYLEPLVEKLDAYLDKRLVQTFLQGIRTIIQARNQAPGLVISEVGAQLLSGREATAGEKRLHRLLTSEKWNEDLIKVFQWNEAQKRYEELRQAGEQVFVIWDGSVLEKPESQRAADLCAVKSSKAARRKKSRKGSFNQPGGKPIVVLGFEWTACVVVGKTGKPSLAMMQFWRRKGPEATSARVQEVKMLEKVARKWGTHVLPIFDRGYAGGPWLEVMWRYQLHFLIRWKKGHHVLDEHGQEKSLGQMGKQKRSWGHRMIWDERNRRLCQTGIVAVQVRHPSDLRALWVVLVRRAGEPWYLVTTRCIETEEQAWECYHA
jgi:hypothetical protein